MLNKYSFLSLTVFMVLISACLNLFSLGIAEDKFNVPTLTNWHKESGVRIRGGVSTSVIRLSDGRYRIFYPDRGEIASFVSSDGLTFTKEFGMRVSRGGPISYDARVAGNPDIVLEDGYYRMYYTGIGNDDKLRILSAVSKDGFNFTKEEGARIDYAANYRQLADVCSVVKISNNNYKMYFVYDWHGDNSLKGATSSDGLNWTVQTLSGFTRNCMDPEVLLDKDGTLIMFFAGPATTIGPEPMYIYKAISTDGSKWDVVGKAIIPEKSEEGIIVGDPDIIQLPDGTYRMYYYGCAGRDNFDILSATAENL